MKAFMHEERLQSVHDMVRRTEARTVLDLGCGPGPLLQRLAADARFTRIVGVDEDRDPLDRLRAALPDRPDAKGPVIEIVNASISSLDDTYQGFDLALLIESIEHMTAPVLRETVATVFGILRPRFAIVTTPNIEFNHLLGVPASRLRHPGHRFEWTRDEFSAWCDGIRKQFFYEYVRSDICGAHSQYGGATQLALFELNRRGPT